MERDIATKSRANRDDVNSSLTMSKQAKKLVEETLLAMSAGVRDAQNVANQGKGDQAVGINTSEKIATNVTMKAQKAQEFEAKERQNKTKQNILGDNLNTKELKELKNKGRDGASVTGDNKAYEKETVKKLEKALNKKREDIKKNLRKNGKKDIDVKTPNAKKAAKQISENKDSTVEVKVQDSSGKELAIKADSEKEDIQEKVKTEVEKHEEKQETAEERAMRLSGRGQSKDSAKKKSANDERVMHNKRNSQNQSISEIIAAKEKRARTV